MALTETSEWLASLEFLLRDFYEEVEPKEPKARAVSTEFLNDQVYPALASNQPLESLWERVNNKKSLIEKAYLMELMAVKIWENPPSDQSEVLRTALLCAAKECLSAEGAASAERQRMFLLVGSSLLFSSVASQHNFGEAGKIIEEILSIDNGLDFLTGEDMGILFVNGLQALIWLGETEQSARFLEMVQLALADSIRVIPFHLRVMIMTKMASLGSVEDQNLFKGLEQANTSLQKTEEDMGVRKNLEDNAVEIALMQLKALLGQPGFVAAKRSFVSKFGTHDNFKEDWAHILLEEGLFTNDRVLLSEALQIHEEEKQDFHLAEAHIRILTSFPDFYPDLSARQAIIIKHWVTLERALGQNIVALMSMCLDMGDRLSEVSKTAVATVVDASASEDYLREAALESLDHLEGGASLMKSLFACIVKYFGADLKKVDSPLGLIKGATKKAFLAAHAAIEKRMFTEPGAVVSFELIENHFTLSGVEFVDLTLGAEKAENQVVAFDNFVLEGQNDGLPGAVAQKIIVPLDAQRACVMRRCKLPLLSDSEIYWLSKLLQSIYAQDLRSLFSAENSWERLVTPEPDFEVLRDEDLDTRFYDGKPFRQIFEEVHFKEAGVDLIPDGIIEWHVLLDKQTGAPLGFLSLNEVKSQNYALMIEGLSELGETACLEHLRGLIADPTLLFENLVEITNMGIVYRFLSAEILASLFLSTAKRIEKNKNWKESVVITIQTMLQRRYKALELGLTRLTEDAKINQEQLMQRLSKHPDYEASREAEWIKRGRGTRGFFVSMKSTLSSDPLRRIAKNLKTSI